VARRPSIASREEGPATAGMRRFFSLEQRVEKKVSALVVVVVVVARLLDAVFFFNYLVLQYMPPTIGDGNIV